MNAPARILALSLLLAAGAAAAAGPRTHYLLHCSGCHRVGGEGSPPNVPTLHRELGRMVAEPAMRGYLARVPGAAHAPLSDAQLAGVLNWVLERFNAETLPEGFERLSAAEVAAARARALADPVAFRARHWKPYPG